MGELLKSETILSTIATRRNQHAKIIFMVLRLSISVQAEAGLRAKSAAAGVDVETYAARHLERMAAPPKSPKEISGPICEAFARSRMSEDELSDFLEAEKHAMRTDRWGRHTVHGYNSPRKGMVQSRALYVQSVPRRL
jgi:hypothetical protein